MKFKKEAAEAASGLTARTTDEEGQRKHALGSERAGDPWTVTHHRTWQRGHLAFFISWCVKVRRGRWPSWAAAQGPPAAVGFQPQWKPLRLWVSHTCSWLSSELSPYGCSTDNPFPCSCQPEPPLPRSTCGSLPRGPS